VARALSATPDAIRSPTVSAFPRTGWRGIGRGARLVSLESSELTFRALLDGDGTRDVSFERVLAGFP
jgi:hypothetical protein